MVCLFNEKTTSPFAIKPKNYLNQVCIRAVSGSGIGIGVNAWFVGIGIA